MFIRAKKNIMFRGDPLPEFPHPTRPASSYDVDSDPEPIPVFPQQGFDYQEFHHPQSLSLPKPSPPMDYEIHLESRDEFHSGQVSESVLRDYCNTDSEPTNATSSSLSESERIILSPSTGKTPKGEKEAVDELLLILIETMEELNTRNKEALLQKFVSEIAKEERLERFIVERLKNSRVQAINDLWEQIPIQDLERQGDLPTIDETEEGPVLTRSISESVEELSHKLERFKLREELCKETSQLARENLDKEPRIMELRNQCRIIRTTELAAAQEKVHELERQKEDTLKFYSPASLLHRLQEAMNKTDEESEALHRQLLDGEIDVLAFVRKYKKLRNTYHKRALTHLAAKTSLTG